MNTTLLIRYGENDVELERARISEDHFEIFNLIQSWLWDKQTTTSVRVEEFDSHDICQKCYVVTPVVL